MYRFQVSLDIDTFRALRSLSRREFRDFRAQSSFLIHEALVARGLLNSPKINPSKPNEEDQNRGQLKNHEPEEHDN